MKDLNAMFINSDTGRWTFISSRSISLRVYMQALITAWRFLKHSQRIRYIRVGLNLPQNIWNRHKPAQIYDLSYGRIFPDPINLTAYDIRANRMRKRISNRNIDTSVDRLLPQDPIISFSTSTSARYVAPTTSLSTNHILSRKPSGTTYIFQIKVQSKFIPIELRISDTFFKC